MEMKENDVPTQESIEKFLMENPEQVARMQKIFANSFDIRKSSKTKGSRSRAQVLKARKNAKQGRKAARGR